MMMFMGIMNLLLGKAKAYSNLPKDYCKFNNDRREDKAIEWSHI